MANITGWGRGTWGEGAWNEAIPVEPTGQGATSALGTPTVVAKANVTVTGLGMTTGVGAVTVGAKATASPSGQQDYVDGFIGSG